MSIEIRPISADEVPDFRAVINRAMGGDATDDAVARQRFLDQVDLARTYVPIEDGAIVGSSAALSFDVTLPGGSTTAMGGLTMVAVLPTHRRRGLLNAMMQAHFADCRERGEFLSGLWASESVIYGRYGFGNAASVIDVTINAPNAGIPSGPDLVRVVDVATAREVYPDLYQAARRPGYLSRSDKWWEHRHFRDPQEWRSGSSERRYLVAYRDGTPVGYATYRQKAEWNDSISSGVTKVGELVAVDAAAGLSLWSLLGSIDLFPTVKADNLPLDLDLLWQAANPRLIRRKVFDGLYVRLFDVPGALTARGYETTDSLVIEVADPMGIAGGTFRLDASPDGASCIPTGATAEVTLDIRTLASLYLGENVAAGMARVGRISGSADAVRRLAALLRTDIAPVCPEVF